MGRGWASSDWIDKTHKHVFFFQARGPMEWEKRTDEARAEADGGAEDAQERVGLCVFLFDTHDVNVLCKRNSVIGNGRQHIRFGSLRPLLYTHTHTHSRSTNQRYQTQPELTAGSRSHADVEAARRAGAICRRALGW